MRKIQIAIIDSGVRANHPAFRDSKLQLVRYGSLQDGESFCGHGTAVYNIIRRVGEIADIINFQVTGEDGGIAEETLISCLSDIRDHYDIDILNLSLGLSLCENTSRLKSICDDLASRGIIIISAFDNAGAISYPAAFDNVIGVTSADICRKTNDFIVFNDTVLNIGANGNVQRLAWDSPDYIMLGGNSFACAHVTVQAARFLSEGASDFSQIMNQFRTMGLSVIGSSQTKSDRKRRFEIRNAILFPFSKEMHSIIRFHELLSFEIAGVYDIRASSHVGSTTDHIMKAPVKSYLIRNIDDMDWDSFDTVIIGNIPVEGITPLSAARDALIQKAIQLGKNIFSFDDLRKEYKYGRMFCPVVEQGSLPPERFGKLYRIARPVLGVYGTSSVQGKFTLQLELRKRFLEAGYKVGQIGTEPSSPLFGIDFTYPMGFNQSVYVEAHDSIRYLNECMNELCQEDCDIIITGSQASVLPFDTGNIGLFPLRQFLFLMGTQPDAVVLCVNPYDELEYIKNSIYFLESSTGCKVIAICIYPMNIKKGWKGMYHQKEKLDEMDYQECRDALKGKFLLPVYQLGMVYDMERLFEDIVSFFSENGVCQA